MILIITGYINVNSTRHMLPSAKMVTTSAAADTTSATTTAAVEPPEKEKPLRRLQRIAAHALLRSSSPHCPASSPGPRPQRSLADTGPLCRLIRPTALVPRLRRPPPDWHRAAAAPQRHATSGCSSPGPRAPASSASPPPPPSQSPTREGHRSGGHRTTRQRSYRG